MRRIHRAVGLAFLLFWIAQAASGAFLVFHRELDDLTLASRGDRPLDLDALVARIDRLEDERGGLATAIFSSTGYSDRYDVHFEDAAGTTILRLDGHGRPLRERALEAPIRQGGIYLAVNRLHRNLLAGPGGAWIVGVSGILLVANILIGLRLAWPARAQWRKALLPRPVRSAPAATYGRHRALGLWLGAPALVTIGCGVLLAFEGGTARLLGAEGARPPQREREAAATIIGPAEAARAGLRLYPEADFTGLLIPSAASGLYTVFLRQPLEPDQPEGATRIFVAADTGTVVGSFDPLRAEPAERFMGLLFPIHTGRIGGYAGRFAVLAIGLWLIAMVALGLLLWRARRGGTTRRNAPKLNKGERRAPKNPL